MSKTMADVIAAHDLLEGIEASSPWMRRKELAWCSCGQDLGSWIDDGSSKHPNWDATHAAHVADELTKAGFGSVHEDADESGCCGTCGL